MSSIRNLLMECPPRIGMTGLILFFLFILMVPTYGSLTQPNYQLKDSILLQQSIQTDFITDNAIDEAGNAIAKAMVRPDCGTPARTATKQEHSRVFIRKMQQILLLVLLNVAPDNDSSVKSGIPQGELSFVGDFLVDPLPVRAGPVSPAL